MRTQIKIRLFIALVVLIASSCSQEDVSNPEEFKVAKQQVQFDFNTTEEYQEEGQNHFDVTVISINPLIIYSLELEAFQVSGDGSDELMAGIVPKGSFPNLTPASNKPCGFQFEEGYKYDLNKNCFVFGVWSQWPDCTIHFHPYTAEKLKHEICLSTFFLPEA
ncbi:hypothetical protein M3P19_01675 [Muricauda sp. 2012CJ35-5]|uniref:Lipoprotein n=1 Tax=Flagellimonas spongiicola TaxID=2942208 RepID=A0ABT0PMX3_9FLAO|nr:hypothetical protein [Allomuricauda spongiicola]MCL6272694.1 hypothetical protein [Allomuricauda spongiicola]